MATESPTTDLHVSDLHLEVRGDSEGIRVVLVHGSLATAADEWEAQMPLAASGFRLVMPDRRGYGRSPAADGEDFLRDADDIAALLGCGAHLVGHSYGGLGALFAAATRPEATLSLTLLEPAAFALGQDHPGGRALSAAVRSVWDRAHVSDREWVIGFLKAVGSDPDGFPPEFLDAALPYFRVTRRARPPWAGDLPLAEVAAAAYPKLVVSGGHHDGFEAICDDIAGRIGARRLVVAGAGHEVQFTGDPLNAALLDTWRLPS